MSKKKKHEEHISESWLIPYADILTLLLALFIVMFASSQLSQKKFDQMKESFSQIFAGGSGLTDTFDGSSLVNPFDFSPAAREAQVMQEMAEKLQEEINESGLSDTIGIQVTKAGLEIAIQDKVLFDSGEATIRSDVSPILNTVSSLLKGISNDINVVGHTDSIPINNSRFKSNWELSMTRAVNVMYQLIESGSLNPERFTIQGHGKYKPVATNDTEEGRSKNRRVEVIIVREYPFDETNSVLNDLTNSQTNFIKLEKPEVTRYVDPNAQNKEQ